jgi:glycerol uptake facilitator-like aquaporin
MADTTISLIAEFLGTFLLVLIFFITGGNPFLTGLGVTLIMFLIGGISGSAINPALSAGAMIIGALDIPTGLAYIIVELLAAIAATYAFIAVA